MLDFKEQMEIGSGQEADEVEVGGVRAIAQMKIEHHNAADKYKDQISNMEGQDMEKFNDQIGKESDQDRDIIDDKTSELGVWKLVQHKRKNNTRQHALKEICVAQREKKRLISLGRGDIKADSAA